MDAIVEHVAQNVQPGDCVVILSSGAFGGIHEKLLYRLGDPILPARSEHMERVRHLLAGVGLPPKYMTDDRAGDVLVVADESGIVGCVALEAQDDAAVLHSLAVVPERRGGGLGWMLAETVVERARAAGVQRLYLLTESASDFFAEKLGFHKIERSSVDHKIALTRHFKESAGVAMRLDL